MGDFPFKDPDEARYDGATLFIRGTQSHYVADDILPLIGRFFPRFDMKDIQCGHWVISEKPEAFRKGRLLLPQRQAGANVLSGRGIRTKRRQLQ